MGWGKGREELRKEVDALYGVLVTQLDPKLSCPHWRIRLSDSASESV
jgi:hypothetical protein